MTADDLNCAIVRRKVIDGSPFSQLISVIDERRSHLDAATSIYSETGIAVRRKKDVNTTEKQKCS